MRGQLSRLERVPYKHEVTGSIPVLRTKKPRYDFSQNKSGYIAWL